MNVIEVSDGWLNLDQIVSVRIEQERVVCRTAFRDLIYDHPADMARIVKRMELLMRRWTKCDAEEADVSAAAGR